VSVTFDGFRPPINNLVHPRLAKSELRAVIGPNWCGKTTFMDIITGKTKPDQPGDFWARQHLLLDLVGKSQIARRGSVAKFRSLPFSRHRTVRENLAMALEKNPAAPSHVLFYRQKPRNAAPDREIA